MKIIELPYKKEFLLSLVNNNYSEQTVSNYRRDLFIFQLFLSSKGKSFQSIDKLLVIEYKGFLRSGQHHNAIDKYEVAKNSAEKPKDKLEEAVNSGQDVEMEKSCSKGSKKRPNSKTELSARSINRMLSSLRAYITFLIDIDQKVPISPTAIKMLKTIKRESQVADFKELVKLIEAPEVFESKKEVRLRNRAILELLFSTGMRISELVSLDRDQVSLSGTEEDIQPKIYILGKGKKQRFVYLTDRCVYYIKRYMKIRNDELPALFIPYRGIRRNDGDDNMVRVSQNYVQSIMKSYRKRLGIVIPTTPHSLRHGFATYLAEQGANPAAIQKLLGHESLQTTTRYVHASDKFAQKTHKKYHPLKT